ncbi:hypothetical protein D0Z08_23575 [Nocardioides immobilis]|uniref:Uncharacterized protein n=1 Tax=Nocardioides immobilis TaxID=2049295 RepID=A0A417XWE5_9ACTN|nr:hypothetical protein D0Z08_23575 [Nocardioides immobilis]
MSSSSSTGEGLTTWSSSSSSSDSGSSSSDGRLGSVGCPVGGSVVGVVEDSSSRSTIGVRGAGSSWAALTSEPATKPPRGSTTARGSRYFSSGLMTPTILTDGGRNVWAG